MSSNRSIVIAWSLRALACVLAVGALSACGRRADPRELWRETLTQVSTYDALKAGRYGGQAAVSNLLQYGDTGLGTLDGLDGEVVIVGGRFHHVDVEGVVRDVRPEERMPFADLIWFEPDLMFDVGPMDQAVFQNTMRWKRPDAGHALALRVTGAFSTLTVRSVPRQVEPYPPLEAVVRDQQKVRVLTNVQATLVGFLVPDPASPLLPGGFHLHALTADRSTGGHVLDFSLKGGRIEVDQTPALHVLLPALGNP